VPTEAQGPSTNLVRVVVTDDGSPALSATNAFTVVVREVNIAPMLENLPDQTVAELATLTVTNRATDADVPANVLLYRLERAPEGAVINTKGIFTWTPTEAQGPSTNLVTVVVTDDGSPTLSATNSFTVIVTAPPPRPVILSITEYKHICTVSWSSVPEQRYQLQYKSVLDDGEWTDTGSEIVASGPATSISDYLGDASQRFYRVVLLSPP
jgi:hypothetical protein